MALPTGKPSYMHQVRYDSQHNAYDVIQLVVKTLHAPTSGSIGCTQALMEHLLWIPSIDDTRLKDRSLRIVCNVKRFCDCIPWLM